MRKQIRKASYVKIESASSEKFKYKSFRSIINRIPNIFLNLKRSINSYIQKPRRLLSLFDWERIKEDSFFYILNAFIEGGIMNFALHVLFGVKINPLTMLAYGLLVAQILDIYKQLKNNGSDKRISKK